MNSNDLKQFFKCESNTFPGDFKNDLISLGIDPMLAEEMDNMFNYLFLENRLTAFNIFLRSYCSDDEWSDAILIYINNFQEKKIC